jgi:hypothetical protein
MTLFILFDEKQVRDERLGPVLFHVLQKAFLFHECSFIDSPIRKVNGKRTDEKE